MYQYFVYCANQETIPLLNHIVSIKNIFFLNYSSIKFDIKRNSLLNEGILDIISLNKIKIVKFLLIFFKKIEFLIIKKLKKLIR